MLDGIFVKRRAGIDDRRFAMALASVDSAGRRVIEYSQGAARSTVRSTAPDIAYMQLEKRAPWDHPTSTGNSLKPVKQRLNALRE